MMRIFTSLMLTIVAAGCAFASERPNIVMFVLDDLNDWMSPLGHQQAITPNMDRLAAKGVTFTNAHTAGVFCAPSRSAFFTGRHASSTGCYTTQVYHRDHPNIRPLQQVLQEALGSSSATTQHTCQKEFDMLQAGFALKCKGLGAAFATACYLS